LHPQAVYVAIAAVCGADPPPIVLIPQTPSLLAHALFATVGSQEFVT